MDCGLELAIVRYEARSRGWRDLGGVPPDLRAFLCGWFARDLFESMPRPSRMRDSFRLGWLEAGAVRSIDEGAGTTPARRIAASDGEEYPALPTPASGSSTGSATGRAEAEDRDSF